MAKKIHEWKCNECGYSYNSMKNLNCAECETELKGNEQVITSIVVAEVEALSVEIN